MSAELEKLRYPIGRFELPSRIDRDQIERWISDIEALPGQPQENRQGINRHTTGHALSSRGLDHPPGDSPFAGQSHQQFHPVQMGPDRGPARDQALFRGPVGGTGGLLGDSGLGVSRSVGRAASTLGSALAFPDPAGPRKDVHSPRIRPCKPAGNHWFLCMARTASSCTYPGDDPSGRVESVIVTPPSEDMRGRRKFLETSEESKGGGYFSGIQPSLVNGMNLGTVAWHLL